MNEHLILNFCLKLFCQSRMYRKLQGWISFLLRLNQNIKML